MYIGDILNDTVHDALNQNIQMRGLDESVDQTELIIRPLAVIVTSYRYSWSQESD